MKGENLKAQSPVNKGSGAIKELKVLEKYFKGSEHNLKLSLVEATKVLLLTFLDFGLKLLVCLP